MIQPGMLKLKFQFVDSSFGILWSLFVVSWITHEKCNQQWPFEWGVWYKEGKTGKKQDFLNWLSLLQMKGFQDIGKVVFSLCYLKTLDLNAAVISQNRELHGQPFWNLVEHIRVSLWNTGVKTLYRSIEKWEYVWHKLMASLKSC